VSTNDPQRLITCVHEAAHGVAFVRYGLPFERIVVYRDASLMDEHGYVHSPRHRAPSLQRSIVLLAGPVAEAKLLGRPTIEVLQHTTDHAMAMAALRHDRRYTLETAIGAAQTLVEMHWQNIVSLAHALFKREVLSHAEVLFNLKLPR